MAGRCISSGLLAVGDRLLGVRGAGTRVVRFSNSQEPTANRQQPTLRASIEADLPILYEFQLDPEATRMAAFPSRDWDAFAAHQRRIWADPALIARTIVADGQVAGSIGSYPEGDKRLVGYWIGREHWGRGIATGALAALLEIEPTRPLHAYVAKHNIGSRRVLEKCGFTVIGEERWFNDRLGEEIDEYLLELPAVEGGGSA